MIKKIFFLFFILSSVSCSKSVNQYNTTFIVENGDTMSVVSQKLFAADIIKNKFIFRVVGKISGMDKQLKKGTYLLSPSMSYSAILKILSSGKGVACLVTIPEGYNVYQIAYLLQEKEIVDAKNFFTEIADPERLKSFGLPENPKPIKVDQIKKITDCNGNNFYIPSEPINTIEGFLFPDTYSFEKNMSAKNVVDIFIKHFYTELDSSLLKQIKHQNKSLVDVIILASIIQKEATDESEMCMVSGVYYNRIQRNMILQADPTIIYALIRDGVYDGNIRTKHLRPPWPSPYNTYYVKGLPKGPITNPGKQAIFAALNPVKHEYIFFVGTGKKGKKHAYAETLAEHNKNVQQYIQNIRKK